MGETVHSLRGARQRARENVEERVRQAHALARSGLVDEVFGELAAETVQAWAGTRSLEEREQAWHRLAALDDMRTRLINRLTELPEHAPEALVERAQDAATALRAPAGRARWTHIAQVLGELARGRR